MVFETDMSTVGHDGTEVEMISTKLYGRFFQFGTDYLVYMDGIFGASSAGTMRDLAQCCGVNFIRAVIEEAKLYGNL